MAEVVIGIITAMKCEAEKLIEQLSDAEEYIIGRQKFCKGRIKQNRVVVCVSGVGKVFAAIAAQTLISQFGCGHIINVGVAGSLRDDINIGNIVLADRVVQYDMDTSALGDAVGMVSGINKVYFSCNQSDTDKLVKAAAHVGINHFTGVIATGDRFFKDKKTRAYVANTFNAAAGEMEGAAIGQVCCLYDIPFNVMRIISDKAGESSSEEYSFNAVTLAGILSDVMIKYLLVLL